jgi:hypothetical protein
MPEGEGYGPQNTASTGLNLNILGDLLYAYSGSISVGSAEKTLLEFRTGNYVVQGFIHFSKNSFDGDDMQYQLYLNDLLVLGFTDQYSANDFADNAYPIIIPPFSLVKATSTDDTGDNGRAVLCSVTGRIFGKGD